MVIRAVLFVLILLSGLQCLIFGQIDAMDIELLTYSLTTTEPTLFLQINREFLSSFALSLSPLFHFIHGVAKPVS